MNHGSLRILLVGAGAVGQVYGAALQRGGAEIGFFVKPKHEDETRRGFTHYRLGILRRGYHPERFAGFDVITSVEGAAKSAWDMVWLCVPSTGIRGEAGELIRSLLAALPKSLVVMLQPGPEDEALVLDWVGKERLARGLIPFSSFHAPLVAGDPAVPEPGTAYWFPLGAPTSLSGARAGEVAEALWKGGVRARVVESVGKATAAPGIALNMLVRALDLSGWSWRALASGDALERWYAAYSQALPITCAMAGAPVPAWSRWLSPTLLRLLVPIAGILAPFDLERFFEIHFTKVKDQTRMILAEIVARGKALGMPVDRIEPYL